MLMPDSGCSMWATVDGENTQRGSPVARRVKRTGSPAVPVLGMRATSSTLAGSALCRSLRARRHLLSLVEWVAFGPIGFQRLAHCVVLPARASLSLEPRSTRLAPDVGQKGGLSGKLR
jgi:hypothetical protein